METSNPMVYLFLSEGEQRDATVAREEMIKRKEMTSAVKRNDHTLFHRIKINTGTP